MQTFTNVRQGYVTRSAGGEREETYAEDLKVKCKSVNEM